ncbi:MAG TPA: HAD family phosphatase [bacterium]|nr:HAD family phosphatase [bacterium]
MIQAIVFDMNGVIADDERLHEEAYRQVMVNHGLELSTEEYQNEYMGSPNPANFKKIKERYGLAEDVETLLREKSAAYLELAKKYLKPVAGAERAIKIFAKKHRLALVSSSPLEEVQMVLQHFQVDQYFSVIVSGDDVKIGKPDPEPYLLAAKRLKLKPHQCMAFEDSKQGIISAKAAGMKVVALSTNLSPEDLKLADLVVGDFLF